MPWFRLIGEETRDMCGEYATNAAASCIMEILASVMAHKANIFGDLSKETHVRQGLRIRLVFPSRNCVYMVHEEKINEGDRQTEKTWREGIAGSYYRFLSHLRSPFFTNYIARHAPRLAS
jgi:hypothetical protein